MCEIDATVKLLYKLTRIIWGNNVSNNLYYPMTNARN